MPTYCFRCECGHKEEVWFPMGHVPTLHTCSECEGYMKRDYQAEQVHIGDKEYRKPIVSDSLAIMPSQVEEHKRLFPDIKLDSEHRPMFDNYRKHDDYLKKTGFRKQRQRIKKRGRKLTSK